jgi:hypothetical protein
LRKISPPSGFDPRTVQPVASRYTDYAIPAHKFLTVTNKNNNKLLHTVSDVCRYQTLTIQPVQAVPSLLTVMRPQSKTHTTEEKMNVQPANPK